MGQSMSNEVIFSTDPLRFFFKFSTVVEPVNETIIMIFISISQAVSEIRPCENLKK